MSRWWVSYRQTHLDRSPQNELTLDRSAPNELTLARSSCRKSSPNQGEAFIFRLPEEILLRVLEFTTTHVDCWGALCYGCRHSRNYRGIKTLLCVCRSFHRIASPLLFHTLSFISYRRQLVPPSRSVQRFHRQLKTDPSRGRHCRALAVTIDDITSKPKTKGDFDIANDLASWFTQVRCLRIHGGFERGQYTWDWIRNVVQHMPMVDHLAISREGWGLHLDPIIQNLNFPFLTKLDIHGVSAARSRLVIDPKVLFLACS
jgi:hypothetical protein